MRIESIPDLFFQLINMWDNIGIFIRWGYLRYSIIPIAIWKLSIANSGFQTNWSWQTLLNAFEILPALQF